MINKQEFIGSNTTLSRQYKADELLFVQLESPPQTVPANRWWHRNFLSFVLSGEITMKTPQGEYALKSGDCFFAKKGSALISQMAAEKFCELVVLVPDTFIRSVIKKYNLPRVPQHEQVDADTIIPLVADQALTGFSNALTAYFRQPSPPPVSLLSLKLEELIVNILSQPHHRALKTYFSSLPSNAKPSIREIMESNFFSNLPLEAFAKLCARSLSAFKQDFKRVYQTTPGRWLQEKRLDYARHLLATRDITVEEICMEAGFENRSHFIRVFKNKYGLPPGRMKSQMRAAATRKDMTAEQVF
jgi:AraC-like DNA-binding protein